MYLLVEDSHNGCSTECDAMTVHDERVREFALNYPECTAIMQLID
ncbi:antirestriction protein [Enterobacter kobei]